MTGSFYANNQPREWAEFWGRYEAGTGGDNWSMAITNAEAYSVDIEYGVKNFADSDFTFYTHTIASLGSFYISTGATDLTQVNKILLRGEAPFVGSFSCGGNGIIKAWFSNKLKIKRVKFTTSQLMYVDLSGVGEFEGSMYAAFDKYNNPNLKIIRNLENFKIDNVTDMSYCFRDCNLYVNAPSWALVAAPAHLTGLTTDCFNGNPNIPNRASIHSDWMSD